MTPKRRKSSGEHRLAVIGDVHGNAAALEAVLDDIASLGITRGICTGDLVMRGPDPERCVHIIRRLGWTTVQGNTDLKVAQRAPRPDGHPASLRVGSRSWTTYHLSNDSLAWLTALPRRAQQEIGDARITVSHGAAGDLPVIVDENTSDGDLDRALHHLKADCIVVGHTHCAMVRTVERGLILNPGAVGEGRAKDQRPQWAILTLTDSGLNAELRHTEQRLAPPRAH